MTALKKEPVKKSAVKKSQPVMELAKSAKEYSEQKEISKKKSLSIPEMVERTFQRKYAISSVIGMLFGGFVPLGIFILTHHESHAMLSVQTLIVVASLVYSAKTVYEWSLVAFDSWSKAIGFTVLLEGIMIFSDTQWLSLIALGYLIMINGIGTGINMSNKVGS